MNVRAQVKEGKKERGHGGRYGVVCWFISSYGDVIDKNPSLCTHTHTHADHRADFGAVACLAYIILFLQQIHIHVTFFFSFLFILTFYVSVFFLFSPLNQYALGALD